jgi:cytochrome c peroxidase
MTGVFTSQVSDTASGPLNGLGATGGVVNLVGLAADPHQPCRSAAGSPTGLTVFTPATCTTAAEPVMTLFNAWAGLPNSGTNAGRAAVARGQALFNGGAVLHAGDQTTLSCSTCHALNNLGNNPSDAFFRRLGLDSPDFLAHLAAQDSNLNTFVTRTGGLPVYTITGTTSTACPMLSDAAGNAVPNTNTRTTDPGRAMVSGKCADLGAFKPPLLRDVAVRAPYFHNGAAATLDDVVNFYNARFGIGLSAQQHSDLVAFLRVL